MNHLFRGRELACVIGMLAAVGCSQGVPEGYHVVTEEKAPVVTEVVTPSPAAETAMEPAAPVEPAPTEGQSTPDPGSPPVPEPNPETPAAPATAMVKPAPESTSPAEPDDLVKPSLADSGKPRMPDLTKLTAEQQMAVLRAQALGEPIPDFTKVEEPREIKLLIPEKEFVAEGAENLPRVSFDDIDLLKVLNMEPVPANALDHFPGWLKALDGQRIILRGWMFPPGRTENISKFMFVRDNGICCFQRKPKVYDKLGVTMREGETTKYIEGRPFDVIATLRFAPDVIEGEELFWLYFLDDAIVIDKKS